MKHWLIMKNWLTILKQLKEKEYCKKIFRCFLPHHFRLACSKRELNRWNNYWTTRKKATVICNTSKEKEQHLGFRPTAFDNFKNLLNKDFQPAGQQMKSQRLRKNFLDDYITEKARQGNSGYPGKSVPPKINRKFTRHLKTEP